MRLLKPFSISNKNGDLRWTAVDEVTKQLEKCRFHTRKQVVDWIALKKFDGHDREKLAVAKEVHSITPIITEQLGVAYGWSKNDEG